MLYLKYDDPYYQCQMSSNDKRNDLSLFIGSFLAGGLSSLIPEGTVIMIKSAVLHLKSHLFDSRSSMINQNIFWSYINKELFRRYIPSQALQFALYDLFKRKTEKSSSEHFPAMYFIYGGTAGLITCFIVYPLGYHPILIVNDIIQGNKMKLNGATMKEIALLRIRRIYKGFFLAGIGMFIYRSIYFGAYDLLKRKYSDYNNIDRKILYSFISPQLAALASLPLVMLRKESLNNRDGDISISSINSKMQKFRKYLRLTLTLRGICNSAALLLYDEINEGLQKLKSINSNQNE